MMIQIQCNRPRIFAVETISVIRHQVSVGFLIDIEIKFSWDEGRIPVFKHVIYLIAVIFLLHLTDLYKYKYKLITLGENRDFTDSVITTFDLSICRRLVKRKHDISVQPPKNTECCKVHIYLIVNCSF